VTLNKGSMTIYLASNMSAMPDYERLWIMSLSRGRNTVRPEIKIWKKNGTKKRRAGNAVGVVVETEIETVIVGETGIETEIVIATVTEIVIGIAIIVVIVTVGGKTLITALQLVAHLEEIVIKIAIRIVIRIVIGTKIVIETGIAIVGIIEEGQDRGIGVNGGHGRVKITGARHRKKNPAKVQTENKRKSPLE